MKKLIILLMTAAMIFSLTACGEEKSTSNTKQENTQSCSQQTTSGEDTTDSTEKPENVVSDEEMVGSWISKDGVCFTIKADGTIVNDTRDFCISFASGSEYVTWKIEGNHFIFQEAMGSILKYEIIKQSDQLKLNYLEMVEGDFVAGIIVEEFMTELTKQAEPPASILETGSLSGVWVWQEEKSSGLTAIRRFELYADGTGKILTSIDEKSENATFTWNIEDEKLTWSSVSVEGFGNYELVLSDNYLSDLTGSDFFLKENN